MSRYKLALLLVLVWIVSTSAQSPRASDREHRVVTQCAWNGQTFALRDAGNTYVGEHGDISIQGNFKDSINQEGAVFTFLRGGKVVFTKSIGDLSNPNGWISVSEDQRWLAIDSSNGGAEGGWSVSIVHVETDGSIRDLSGSMAGVMKDFSARHNCAARGDNYQSLRWIAPDQLLLVASVYRTSDCGSEMGYDEGYLLKPSTGKILKRYSEAALLHLPENCTYNVWRPGTSSRK